MFTPAQAAISLTYDDGMAQHLDHAAPDLEAHNLRGTFYVPTGSSPDSPWHARAAEWTALAARGHEIGNHTRTHPCRGRAVLPVDGGNRPENPRIFEPAVGVIELLKN